MKRAAFCALAAVIVLGGADAPTVEQRLWRHRNLGKAFFETPSSVSRAVKELKAALDLAPNSFRDRLNYGLALLRDGHAGEAIPELLKAQKQEPGLPHTWFNLGIAYRRQGQYPEAIRQFERMAQIVPDEPVTHYNLGLLYNLAGREEDALQQFRTAAGLNSALVAPRYQIYNTYRLKGNEEEAAKALAVFQKAREAQQAADETEDMEWCFYAELYDPLTARPAGEDRAPPAALEFRDEKLAGMADPATAGLLTLDAFGEQKTDLLAWSRDGMRLYRGGRDVVADSGLEGVKNVTGAAAGDFDNDGLADLCVLTETGPLLFHNRKGRFEKEPAAALPAGRFDAALWLDFDHDYDYDLFLFGEKSVLLRNENGALREFSGRFPFAPGRATAAVAFRRVPDVMGGDIAVAYADHAGVLYRDRLHGEFEAVPLERLPAGTRSLGAVDADNDGWIDLAFASPAATGLLLNRQGKFAPAAAGFSGADAIAFVDLENRGLMDLVAGSQVYRNRGVGQFAREKAAFPAAVAWAEADFDGDGRADLAAVARDGSLHLLTNRTATKNRALEVALVGVKNPKTAAGAEIEIKAGGHYQKRTYRGVPLVFGLGTRARVDAVRIGWPNGLMQNQTDEAAGRAVYKEAPRMAGSCPMVFAWNGRRFEFISDVLGVAPLGASSGDGGYFPVDPDEYIHLPPDALVPRNGQYEIRITEELHEVSYIDQARLVAVDHPEKIEVFTNEKFKGPPFPAFRLFGVERRVYPAGARDGKGADLLPTLLDKDGVYARGFARDAAGVAEMHSLELEFPAGAAKDNRAVLVLDGWIDWADGSTFLAASQGGAGLVMPYLQVKDAAGRWRTVIEDMGVPSGGPKTMVVDLTGKFLSASREVRIVTNVCLYWDEIFLSEETAAPPARLTALNASADLDLRGFSEAVIDPRREHPERYEYAHWRPEAMWDPVPGLYTRYGDVGALLAAPDDRFVIMGSGDELRLRFDARGLPPVPAGWKRDFLLLVDGWSKDADANTAFGDSVEPLPFHGMSRYPYPPAERFPDDEVHRAWKARYNTRGAARLIERLAGLGAPRKRP